MFREVVVIEVREILRAWLSGLGLRKVAEQSGVDRKTARRYVQVAQAAGLARGGGVEQLTDELLEQVRPGRIARSCADRNTRRAHRLWGRRQVLETHLPDVTGRCQAIGCRERHPCAPHRTASEAKRRNKRDRRRRRPPTRLRAAP